MAVVGFWFLVVLLVAAAIVAVFARGRRIREARRLARLQAFVRRKIPAGPSTTERLVVRMAPIDHGAPNTNAPESLRPP